MMHSTDELDDHKFFESWQIACHCEKQYCKMKAETLYAAMPAHLQHRHSIRVGKLEKQTSSPRMSVPSYDFLRVHTEEAVQMLATQGTRDNKHIQDFSVKWGHMFLKVCKQAVYLSEDNGHGTSVAWSCMKPPPRNSLIEYLACCVKGQFEISNTC